MIHTVYSTPDDVVFIHAIAQQWFLSPEVTEAAIKYGAATQARCDDIRIAYDEWKEHPGTSCAVAHGELIGREP